MKKAKPKKQYEVNIDMRWSESYMITAKTKAEARAKAWLKFAKRTPKRLFDISVDEY